MSGYSNGRNIRGGRWFRLALLLLGALGCGQAGAASAAEILLPGLAGTVGNPRPAADQVGFTDEYPAHAAAADLFFLAAQEVTKAQWDEVRAWGLANGYLDLPEGAGGTAADPTHPVVDVSWYDVAKWCNARSEMEGLSPVYRMETVSLDVYRTGEVDRVQALWSNAGYRLPTEREWELAARGGLEGTDYPWSGSSTFYLENISSSQARFLADGTLPPGQFAANGLGLFDMAGNVAEWCWDWYAEDAYAGSAAQPCGPDHPALEHMKVVRGGSWRSGPSDLRVAARGTAHPGQRQDHVGFRTARTFARAEQAPLVFEPATPQAYGTTNALTCSGGSGTGAVSYEVVSGPGAIVAGTHLAVTGGSGTILVCATKAQDDLYLAAAVTGSVVAAKANPTVSAWPTASALVYGQTLAETTLGNGTATPVGSFAFATPAARPAAGARTESVIFTPDDTANYNATNGPVSVTVNPALLTVAADPQRKAYGAANPPLSFHYSGFVAGEDDAVLAVRPVAGTTVDETTPVGVYPGAITVAGGVAANYEFHYVAADFTVTEAIASLVVAALSANSNVVQVTFGPVADGTSYGLQYRPSLTTGDWAVVGSLAGVAAPSAAMTHTNAAADCGYYRVAGLTGPSAKTWGYARVAKPGNSKLNMVGIPFTTSNQTLNSLMDPLQFSGHHLSPGSADQIMIWNPAAQAYINLALYDVRSFGAQYAYLTGWKPYTNFMGSNYVNPVLPAGSAVWLRSAPASGAGKVTIAGEVVAAAAVTNNVVQGLQLAANPFSETVGLSNLHVQAHATGHFLSPGSADQTMIWDAGTQSYLNLALYDVARYYGPQYAYLTGWKAYTNFNSQAPYVSPTLRPGQGFWYKAVSNDFAWGETNKYLDALQ